LLYFKILPLGGITLGSTAHWRHEVGKTTSLNIFTVRTLTGLYLELRRFGASLEEQSLVGRVQVPHNSMIHMVSVTTNYAIVVFYPVTIDFQDMFLNKNLHPLGK
jgi:carotenoid cleavage dioxygenase-like enzyme